MPVSSPAGKVQTMELAEEHAGIRMFRRLR